MAVEEEVVEVMSPRACPFAESIDDGMVFGGCDNSPAPLPSPINVE